MTAETAVAIADAVRGGERSAREVIDAHFARYRATAELNAFVSVDWPAAVARADDLDRRRARGEVLGALAGVPVSVKDVIAVEGFPVTVGSLAFAGNRARATADAVARLSAADAIVVGKTNLPEFAFGTTCDSPLLGPTRNPLADDRSPGGSSGGEAAAVSAGVSVLGIGTDYGGSLRWPAACTGIVAIRPTAGSIPRSGQVPGAAGDMSGRSAPSPDRMQSTLQVIGPLARTVDDLELALGLLSGGGHGTVPEGFAPRIGWTDGADIGPVRDETRRALAELGSALGATEVAARLRGALEAYNAYRDLDPLLDHRAAVTGREHLLADASRASLAGGALGDELSAARDAAAAAAAAALAVFDEVDVLLLPVAGGPACDSDGVVDIDGTPTSGWELMAHCRAVTMLGAPAVSVPVGRSAEGLPLSVQVVAAPGRDALALEVARRLAA